MYLIEIYIQSSKSKKIRRFQKLLKYVAKTDQLFLASFWLFLPLSVLSYFTLYFFCEGLSYYFSIYFFFCQLIRSSYSAFGFCFLFAQEICFSFIIIITLFYPFQFLTDVVVKRIYQARLSLKSFYARPRAVEVANPIALISIILRSSSFDKIRSYCWLKFTSFLTKIHSSGNFPLRLYAYIKSLLIQKIFEQNSQLISKLILFYICFSCKLLIKVMDFGALAIVIFVWGIIVSEFITYMYFYVPILYKHRPLQVYIYVPIFVIWVILLCISYFYSIMVQPGTPSSDINVHYSEQIDDLKNFAKKDSEAKKVRRKQLMRNYQAQAQEVQSLNHTSYCFKCDTVKEIRVHHCKICKKCIERMDHHCPWVGNCVGKFNHKYFILFLFYASTALFMASGSIGIDFALQTFNSEKETIYYILIACCFTTLMLALAIGFLFVTQMLSSIKNLTTLQTFVQGIDQLNPWDKRSWVKNLQQIFGSDKAFWILPTTPDFQSIEYRPLNV